MTPNRQLTTFRRLWAAPRARFGLIVLGLMCVACFGSLGWSRTAMRAQRLVDSSRPPFWATSPDLKNDSTSPRSDTDRAAARYWLGSDDLGRSLLARTLFGGALSLTLGAVAAAIAVFIGTTYGLIAGYAGGRCDALMMRLVDVLYALPYVLLVMLLTISIGPRMERAAAALRLSPEIARFAVLVFGIGGVSWLTMARVVRGQVLSLRERSFVEAARSMGTSTITILMRHILPNTLAPIIVFATLTIPQAILQESFLSFLGVGVQPPQATWGSLAADGVRGVHSVQMDWWLLAFPAGALSITLLALQFVGDSLRDSLDVREQ
ncbi:MAG: ABC transporter permease [Phycisphaerales bacterium]|nr:ABC transporter permease [Phycisphaerales bacterium]